MADGTIALDEPATVDKLLDTESLTVGANTVQRERVQIAGTAATDIAPVTAANGLDVDVTRVQGSVAVTNAGTFATQVDGAALTALQKIDNLAHAGQDVALVEHVPISGQFDDTATVAVTENQVAPVRISSRRALLVEGVASGTAVAVSAASLPLPSGAATLAEQQTQSASLSVLDDWDNAASDGASVSGDVAHDAVDAGEPVKIGFTALNAVPSVVSANADRTRAIGDFYGTQFVRGDHINKWSYHADGSSALTDASVQAAPGAGLSVYITDIIVSLGAASALNVFFEEGVTKILGPYYLEAVNGRSLHLRFTTPKKATANTAVTVTTSAAVAHAVDVTGFIAP